MTADAHLTQHVQKEVRVYLTVFFALFLLTVVTVGVSYLHLSLKQSIVLALCIATIKASLVACFFMHLISERMLIYLMLTLVVIVFLGLLMTPVIGHFLPLKGTEIVS